jgi:hypothetical protein
MNKYQQFLIGIIIFALVLLIRTYEPDKLIFYAKKLGIAYIISWLVFIIIYKYI